MMSRIDACFIASHYMPQPEYLTLVCTKQYRAIQEAVRAILKTPTKRVKGEEPTAFLHYFRGGMDWYILTRPEKEEPNSPMYAYAFTVNRSFLDGAEYGEVSIKELREAGAELDLFFSPRPMAEIKAQHKLR